MRKSSQAGSFFGHTGQMNSGNWISKDPLPSGGNDTGSLCASMITVAISWSVNNWIMIPPPGRSPVFWSGCPGNPKVSLPIMVSSLRNTGGDGAGDRMSRHCLPTPIIPKIKGRWNGRYGTSLRNLSICYGSFPSGWMEGFGSIESGIIRNGFTGVSIAGLYSSINVAF